VVFDKRTFTGEFMHIARLAGRTGAAVALAGCLALGGFMAPAAFAQGNDGTVKVDESDLATPPPDDDPDNDPMVDCIFDIEFFSFDDGLEAKVTFTGHAPTGPGITLLTDTVTLGETVGGGNDLVAEKEYDLSSLVDQLGDPKNQGFHIKLQVDVPSGTESTAYSKFKVFWVTCAPPTSAPPTSAPPTSAPPTSAPPTSESPAPVPTDVPAGADGAGGGGGSAAGLLGLAVVVGGAVAGTAVFARRRFLHDS
jgi:hypothetical protein